MTETTTPSDVVLVEKIGHTQLITINRPDVRNCVNIDVHMGVGEALEAAQADREIRSVILTGAGDKAFCAGADLKAVARGEEIRPTEGPAHAWGFAGYVEHQISKPTIAAVNGPALGGGTELALASDLVIAADTATFGLPEVKRGVLAAAGGAVRLAQQIPSKAAMELLLTGDAVSAYEAKELGLINRVVPFDTLIDAALELAERINVNAPLSVQATKQIAQGIRDGRKPSEDEGWALNRHFHAALRDTHDFREGPRAFAEKRAPQWRGE